MHIYYGEWSRVRAALHRILNCNYSPLSKSTRLDGRLRDIGMRDRDKASRFLPISEQKLSIQKKRQACEASIVGRMWNVQLPFFPYSPHSWNAHDRIYVPKPCLPSHQHKLMRQNDFLLWFGRPGLNKLKVSSTELFSLVLCTLILSISERTIYAVATNNSNECFERRINCDAIFTDFYLHSVLGHWANVETQGV